MSSNAERTITNDELIDAVEQELLDEFNRMLGEFMIKMIKVMKPYKRELKTAYKTYLAVLNTGQTAAPLLNFWKHAREHKDEIMAVDLSTAETFISKHASEYDVFTDIDVIGAWGQMPDCTKKAIVSYFRGLFVLAESYNNKSTLLQIGEQKLLSETMIANSRFSADDMNAVMNDIISGQVTDEMKQGMNKAAGVIDEYVKKHGRMPRGQDDFKELVEMSQATREQQQQTVLPG